MKVKICTTVFVVMAVSLAYAGSAAPTFHFFQYPGSMSTHFYGVSNNNVGVGGYLDSNGAQHGFMVTQAGKFTTIDNPNGITYLEGINSSGTIVGYYIDSSSNYFAFMYVNGVFTNIGPPGGSQTLAFGINDNGVISGEYLDPTTGMDEGFTFDGTNYQTVLGPVSGAPALVYGTNVHGISTVQWGDSSGNTESSLYNGTGYKTVNVPGAVSSYIHGIDAAGDAVYSWTDSQGVFHGAALVGGKMTVFDAPGCTGGTYADSINDHHVIAGVCHVGTSVSKGFYITY